MAAKVEQVSSVEAHHVKPTASLSTSSASSSSPKVSMFGAKSGFVIPKNKLSGSMVPIFRGGQKVEASETAKEESKQVQRKTKWGVDLTQDAAVRRGRALAYQTRVEQITKQLKSGALEVGDGQGSKSPVGVPNQDSSNHQIDSEEQKFEILELEKRDAIGEILLLNPSYKAPPDYKPLLKEAKVPIPLKAYPGYNFIRLILGHESNTQKQLEEETGAKIRVHGTKTGSGGQMEITQADGDEAQVSYEELYVHVSADTFEKVDAAVALIELLVTPVSGNPVTVSTASTSIGGDTVNVLDSSQGSAISYLMPAAAGNPGVVHPIPGIAQSNPSQVQLQPYPGPWLPLGSPQTPPRPPSGFLPPSSNSIRLPPTMNPFNSPPILGGQPPVAGGFGSVPGNTSFIAPRQQPPMPVLQRPYMPETRPFSQTNPPHSHPILNPQAPPTPHALTTQATCISPAFSSSQTMSLGAPLVVRPPISSMPQSMLPSPSGPHSTRPLTSAPPDRNTSGWASASSIMTPPLRAPNMMQVAPIAVPPQGPRPGVLQSTSAASVAALSSITTNPVSRPLAMNVVPLPTLPLRPSASQIPANPLVNHSAGASGVSALSFAPPHVGVPPAPRMSSTCSVAQTPISLPGYGSSPTPMQTLLPSSSARPLPIPSSVPALMLSQSQASVPVNTSSPGLRQVPPPVQSSLSAVSVQPAMPRLPAPVSSLKPGEASISVLPPAQSASPRPPLPVAGSVSVSLPSFSPINLPVTSQVSVQLIAAPKPQRPSSSDFTFQPLNTQLAASHAVPRPNSNIVPQNAPLSPAVAIQPPSAPQAPSFRPALNNSAPQLGHAGFPRPQAANQMGQPRTPVLPPSSGAAISFPGNPTGTRPGNNLPSVANARPASPATSVNQMGNPSFLSPLPGPIQHGTVPPIRPGNLQQLHKSQPSPTNRPGGLVIPNQQFNKNNLNYASRMPAPSPTGGNQIYDPFSPTSISAALPQQGNDLGKARKQEPDAEYEDLMASVGVR